MKFFYVVSTLVWIGTVGKDFVWLNFTKSKDIMPKIKHCAHKPPQKDAREAEKFVSEVAKKKYRDLVRHKEFYVEQGMVVEDDNFGSMPPWLIENIKKRKWLELCKDLTSAVFQVVREFYAKFLAHELPAEIMVEVKVKFSDRDINHYYQLKNVTYEFSKDSCKLTDELMHKIVP